MQKRIQLFWRQLLKMKTSEVFHIADDERINGGYTKVVQNKRPMGNITRLDD